MITYEKLFWNCYFLENRRISRVIHPLKMSALSSPLWHFEQLRNPSEYYRGKRPNSSGNYFRNSFVLEGRFSVKPPLTALQFSLSSQFEFQGGPCNWFASGCIEQFQRLRGPQWVYTYTYSRKVEGLRTVVLATAQLALRGLHLHCSDVLNYECTIVEYPCLIQNDYMQLFLFSGSAEIFWRVQFPQSTLSL